MQIARADLSLGYGGAGGSRACKASGQGQGQGQGIESCFYGFGKGVALVDSRESLGRVGLARIAWARARESFGASFGKGFSKGGLQDLQKSLQKWRDFALQFAPIVRSCYLKAVPDCAKVCQN